VPGDYSDSSFVLSKPDPGESVALWRLEGEIERTLPDQDYKELIAVEKKRLSEEPIGPGGRKVDLARQGN
jgi:hypothetical protein